MSEPNANPLIAFKQQLDVRADQFKAALPAHMPPERFSRVVLTAVQNNPDLLNADRPSLWNACMRAAQDGLLPDGRDGAIVIYNTKEKGGGWVKKAQWMPMVWGIVKKVRNSGQLAMITARVVYGGDKYRYWLDEDGEHILYEPCETPDRNHVRLVFAAARTTDGELMVEPLTAADIDKIRASSKAKDNGPWVDWWDEMARKSAIRRLAKRLPMSSDLDDLVRRDDELYDFSGARDAKAPAQLVSLDFTEQQPAAPSPPPAGAGPASPHSSEAGAAGAEAPAPEQNEGAGKPDGDTANAAAGGSDGAPAPSPDDADDSYGDLLESFSAALLDAKSPRDVDAIEGMFAGDFAGAPTLTQALAKQAVSEARAAIQAKLDADDSFPGDRPMRGEG